MCSEWIEAPLCSLNTRCDCPTSWRTILMTRLLTMIPTNVRFFCCTFHYSTSCPSCAGDVPKMNEIATCCGSRERDNCFNTYSDCNMSLHGKKPKVVDDISPREFGFQRGLVVTESILWHSNKTRVAILDAQVSLLSPSLSLDPFVWVFPTSDVKTLEIL